MLAPFAWQGGLSSFRKRCRHQRRQSRCLRCRRVRRWQASTQQCLQQSCPGLWPTHCSPTWSPLVPSTSPSLRAAIGSNYRHEGSCAAWRSDACLRRWHCDGDCGVLSLGLRCTVLARAVDRGCQVGYMSSRLVECACALANASCEHRAWFERARLNLERRSVGGRTLPSG